MNLRVWVKESCTSLSTAAAVMMLKHGEKWQVLLGHVTQLLEERGGLCGMALTAELWSKVCRQWWPVTGVQLGVLGPKGLGRDLHLLSGEPGLARGVLGGGRTTLIFCMSSSAFPSPGPSALGGLMAAVL